MSANLNSASGSNPGTTTVSTGDSADEAEAVDDSVPVLDTDTMFGLLKNRRRRDVLRYLFDNPGTATMSDVAEFVAARENDIPERQLSSKQRKRVYVALYQCHLPMMDDAGIIDFNRPRGHIDITPVADQLQPYLVDSATDASSWRNYFAVTTFGGLLYIFSSLLIGPGSWFATLSVFGLIFAIIGLSIVQGRDTLSTLVMDFVSRPTGDGASIDAANDTISNPADD